MTYQFEQNEFTSWELLQYFKSVYESQINGKPFSNYNLQNWVTIGKVPDLYGGYKIIKTERYKELQNLLVITLDSLSRKEMIELIDNPSDSVNETKNKKRRADKIANNKTPRKQRTELYYQILGSRNTTKKNLEQSIIPKYFKEAGGKRNQLV